MRALALLFLMIALEGAAVARASECRLPATIARPHAVLPTRDEPRRLMPITGYTLALTWVPEYCFAHRREQGSFECGAGARFGFVLHGLWPDGQDGKWPQYCRPVALLPENLIRANLCATPSPQLLQHEYAKHGSCTGLAPADYFRLSTSLYSRLHFPDMEALARRPGLTAGALAQALARANPGVEPQMVRIALNKRGWLEEVRFCLDREQRFTRCIGRGGAGVAPATARVRIAQPTSARIVPERRLPPFRDGAGRDGGG